MAIKALRPSEVGPIGYPPTGRPARTTGVWPCAPAMTVWPRRRTGGLSGRVEARLLWACPAAVAAAGQVPLAATNSAYAVVRPASSAVLACHPVPLISPTSISLRGVPSGLLLS